ncbi:hypothetical protein [Clostridium diolis]|uniref:DUF5659 domain-containing protein n=1 Tax=Clostridium diolis TaxID=223919 RepID=A0AAV3W9A1_9CLOT|nr:hypothetical protein [Clostridium diolis]QES71615.1 hypothetical protein F3K33_01775 [Clostridium diolis]GEA33624.1 hypothetical protein CDIOL_45470 [Clostridium diolis]
MNKENVLVTFRELGLIICKADTKRKVTCPIWDKITLKSVFIFYRMGYVFRDSQDSKKYYSSDEITEKVKRYLAAL